ncbi:macro domain-containing protein [Nitrosovibrio tenuis]|uniref:O-acetyl-ADP-ribose deacetylase (Regulator of RNase III), contains Macro domain n=1 Tax=Nitrosovibrio tenuis TaxID=1233 RepID=A0A1H7KMY7_9PROT|nr:macro domain-containing protein [Nitrosovibrio tenuis]SEK87307.1 O-acetyl-ADP-ribose deacetylase (regulator of RNase III), contains Macro domain [Nitrosovibrio tenuis]
MIHEVKGDILLSHAQVIAHAIAPLEHFDQGLALSLREQWPALVKDYHHFYHAMRPKSGDAWVWSGAMSKHIINLLVNEAPRSKGQKPGRASPEHVDHALRELRHLLESQRFASLALPRLATGAGGLDWHMVRPMIDYHLGDLALPIYIYIVFEKGMQAIEPGLSHNGGAKRKKRFTGQNNSNL